jgi:predicted enzyme related to lactoylglutathione lyase
VNAAIDTVIVFTTRMEALADFYRQSLGLEAPREHGGNHLGFQVGDLYLGFDQADEESVHPGAVTVWFRVDDLNATFERMVGLGATVRNAPLEKPWGDRLAAVYDPDGNMVGLSQRRSGG